MIFTSYFAKLNYITKMGLTPVSIARRPPSWYRGLEYLRLAPTAELLQLYKFLGNTEFYTEQYNKQLNELDCRQVYKDLLEMCNYTNIVLLCFETPQTFCHRHLVVDWFNKNGIPAQEIYYGTTSR